MKSYRAPPNLSSRYADSDDGELADTICPLPGETEGPPGYSEKASKDEVILTEEQYLVSVYVISTSVKSENFALIDLSIPSTNSSL